MTEDRRGIEDWLAYDGAPLDGPRAAPKASAPDRLIVFLHGFGADGGDLFGLAQPFAGRFPTAAFAAPNAPRRCGVNPMGYEWFPIPWIDGSSEEEMRRGFLTACSALDAYLDAELARYGLADDRLALVGFSQGTMMSLEVGPRRRATLAGIVGFSGRFATADRIGSAPHRPPIALAHGDLDDVIPVSDLKKTHDALESAGFSVLSHVSRGIGHGIAPDGLELAVAFLDEAFGQGVS